MSNLADNEYYVSGFGGFTLSEAMQLWKTKYRDDIRDFHKEVCNHPSMDELKDYVTEMWDTIQEIDATKAFQVQNVEKRRAFFDAIGVAKLMDTIQPTLLDRQVITKKRTDWDDDNNEVEKVFEDVYELYLVPKEKLYAGIEDRWFAGNEDAYVVRCWCTTTNREYWIFTDRRQFNSHYYNSETGKYEQKKADAIQGIAWTIRINVSNPERIYRQGDIIVVKHSLESKEVEPYHLTKDQYLQLMYSET